MTKDTISEEKYASHRFGTCLQQNKKTGVRDQKNELYK